MTFKPFRRNNPGFYDTLAAAQGGDRAAQNVMTDAILPLIVREAKKAYGMNPENTINDYVNDALVYVLAHGIRNFNPELSEWVSYGYMVARAGITRARNVNRVLVDKRHALNSTRRREYLEKNNISDAQFWAAQKYVPMEPGLLAHDCYSPEADIETRDLIGIVRKYVGRMPKSRNKEIMLMHMRGDSGASIARTYGISTQAVSQKIQREIIKIRKFVNSAPNSSDKLPVTSQPLNATERVVLYDIVAKAPKGVSTAQARKAISHAVGRGISSDIVYSALARDARCSHTGNKGSSRWRAR